MTLVPWAVAALAMFAAGGLAWTRWRRAQADAAAEPADPRTRLRSVALDALGEAVLLTDADGDIVECNSAACVVFERDRGMIEAQHTTTLRRFEGVGALEPYRAAREHAVWTGEAWARQPDGGMRLCEARVLAVHDGSGQVSGYVESYRDAIGEGIRDQELRDLLYGIRAFEPGGGPGDETLRHIRAELRLLSEAFRDLDVVVQRCQQLLPSLAANDPLTEVIAGAAHEARSAAAGMPALRERIPRSLARLRGYLQQLAARSAGTAEAVRLVSAAGTAERPAPGSPRAMPR